MRCSVAVFCLPILSLVFQASLCLASRPTGSRTLLATAGIGAGLPCSTDDLCSNGDGTTKTCPGLNSMCPVIAAGAVCTSKDFCSDGRERTLSSSTGTLCPSDPSTLSGTCPFVPAGSPCRSNDRCATDATNSAACVAGRSGSGICPMLLAGVTCSAVAGECSGEQDCSAPWVVKDSKALLLAGDFINDQDSTRGVCVDSTPAGSPCTVGSSLCSGYGQNPISAFCSGSSCPLTRPGQMCSDVAPRDKCFDDTTDGGKLCPVRASANDQPVCPALAVDKKCLAGDQCAAGQACNAVGTAFGQCVPSKAAGAPCATAVAADSTTNSPTAAQPADKCSITLVEPLTFKGTSSSADCAASNCPKVPAGQACLTGDTCSDGTANGVACTALDGVIGSCPAIPDDKTACFENDKCDGGRICDGRGTTAAGSCVVPKPAGGSCTAEIPASTGVSRSAGDFCAPVGGACPTGGKCPVIPAGARCSPAVAASAAGDVPAVTARDADKCFNGNTDATKSTTNCAPAASFCPSLATGSTCTLGADLCIRGAQCISGLCQPSSKAFASSTPASPSSPSRTASTPAGFSKEANVPAVTLSPILTNFDVNNFTASVATQYCNTIQANIVTAYNVVSNCSTGTPSPGSVVVPTTIAFSGEDNTAAKAAQTSFSSDLKKQVTTVFGTAYGTVTVPVDSVKTTEISNPVGSGAVAAGMVWTVGVALMISALVMTV